MMKERFEKDEFERTLEEGLCGVAGDAPPKGLRDAAAHAVMAGGKRLRPFLCDAAAHAVGWTKKCAPAVLAYAKAIEYLHSYTLVHDDLPCMDNDRERRGKPTVWVKFGEGAAVLAGDWLQALAFEHVLRAGHASAVLAARELASAATRVVAGQVLDLQHAGTRSRKKVEAVHVDKTAALFEAAVCMGGLAAGGTEGEIAALRVFGRSYGMAFQIADDIEDAETGNKVTKELSMCNAMEVSKAWKLLEGHVKTAMKALRAPGCFANGNKGALEAVASRLLAK